MTNQIIIPLLAIALSSLTGCSANPDEDTMPVDGIEASSSDVADSGPEEGLADELGDAVLGNPFDLTDEQMSTLSAEQLDSLRTIERSNATAQEKQLLAIMVIKGDEGMQRQRRLADDGTERGKQFKMKLEEERRQNQLRLEQEKSAAAERERAEDEQRKIANEERRHAGCLTQPYSDCTPEEDAFRKARSPNLNKMLSEQ